MEEKLGVFICTGYGIAEALDIEALRKEHLDIVKEFLKNNNLSLEDECFHLSTGEPRDVIPALVKKYNFDTVVMGTVARTGISGFLMGNAAEQILRRLRCSVLALKPEGFKSPVELN